MNDWSRPKYKHTPGDHVQFDEDFEWYEDRILCDPYPRYIRGPCRHHIENVVGVYSLDIEVAQLCLTCDAQLNTDYTMMPQYQELLQRTRISSDGLSYTETYIKAQARDIKRKAQENLPIRSGPYANSIETGHAKIVYPRRQRADRFTIGFWIAFVMFLMLFWIALGILIYA